MSHPTPNQFEEFYRAINGFDPFPWQSRLAARVCAGDWPHAIALPTAAGKTTCIDIALFALACRAPNAARRIFFVVDRRIVVDQAYEHARKLADRLQKPEHDIERVVADSLKDLAFRGWQDLPEDEKKDIRPLDVYALRGGMYRESAWTRSPLQPTVIASTVDQVGSRLLFRGYGISDSMRPIHAGLVGNDSLILLDEAHCAKPFDQTMQAVKSYRGWHESRSPFTFVSVTATPINEDNVMRADEADERHPVLGKRIKASKPATLVVAEKAKGKNGAAELVKMLEKQARDLFGQDLGTDKDGTQHRVECVGIIVNRVKTARLLRDSLKKEFGDDVVLLTGRMRPLDRDRIFEKNLRPLLSNAEGTPPKFVIGTQCLECGADFDFHALVTECASLDALRQRFGRLNRVANRPAAKAVIVIRGDDVDKDDPDPVYGESLPKTWQWLNEKATEGVIDFGVSAMKAATEEVVLDPYNAPAEDAPVLFPAHLDCWVQTHPSPTPDPDPAIFLHGPTRTGQPDVQVVFRSDLGSDNERWAEIVALCPPSSSEAVAVPISVFRNWLTDRSVDDQSGDVQGEAIEPDNSSDLEPTNRTALCWRGPTESNTITDPRDIRPNQVYVLPASPDVGSLADFPTDVPDDFAEEAFLKSRDKALLRLPDPGLDEDDDEFAAKLTAAIRAEIAKKFPGWLDRVINALTDEKRRVIERYPEPLKGFVVSGRKRLGQFEPTYFDDSEPAESYRGRKVTLEEHSRGVAEFAKRFAQGCELDAELYYTAGLCHDLGKLDPRFQAMLKQTSPHTAVGPPLAKSSKSPGSPAEREEARRVHGYPKGARHELLSAAILEKETDDDLLLHLIATHHGSGRPFADAVSDTTGMLGRQSLFGFKPDSCLQDIAAWNTILPERFWRIVRKLGWWGSAYHEAVFRLADHAQSRWEQEHDENRAGIVEARLPTIFNKIEATSYCSLPLLGFDGSNPLAFLAALGTLLAATRVYPGTKMRWERQGPWIPVLCLPGTVSPEILVEKLAEELGRFVGHPAFALGELRADNLVGTTVEFHSIAKAALAAASNRDRTYFDYLASFGTDAISLRNNPEQFADTSFRTMAGAGHQHFLKFMRNIIGATRAEHLAKAMFASWRYDDPLTNHSLRWDPADDVRYALRWKNPSSESTLRAKSGSVLGANRLAIEGIRFFPCIATNTNLATTGFRNPPRADIEFSWPIWQAPLGGDAVRSMLSCKFLQTDEPEVAEISTVNTVALFRSRRITQGKFRNFTPARPVL